MIKRIFYLHILWLSLSSIICSAYIYDNRFFPLFRRPYVTVEGRPSHFALEAFVTTASEAIGKDKDDGVPLGALFGKYDQNNVADSLVALGNPNPLRSEWQGKTIPWRIDGKIQSQGLAFSYHQSVTDWLYLGFYWMFMRVNSRQEFFFQRQESQLKLQGGDLLELDATRRQMHRDLGLGGNHSEQSGMGDLAVYLRFGKIWEYVSKFRKVDAGLSLGLLVPAGQRRDIDQPASVPFGGDGHWGFYISGDVELELKEDWKAGLLLRIGKRFPRTQIHRMPIGNVPHVFGAIVGPARVNPGVTLVASPYFSVENLREGLGARVMYTLTHHEDDEWEDARSDKTVPVNLAQVSELSSWASDYFTLNVFYDFGKVKVDRGFAPILTASWDIPAAVFLARRVSKTHKVSLGIEFNF